MTNQERLCLLCTPKFYAILVIYHWRDVEFIFVLLLAFFFIVLYVIPVALGVVLLYFVVSFVVDKFSSYGDPNDVEEYDHDP